MTKKLDKFLAKLNIKIEYAKGFSPNILDPHTLNNLGIIDEKLIPPGNKYTVNNNGAYVELLNGVTILSPPNNSLVQFITNNISSILEEDNNFSVDLVRGIVNVFPRIEYKNIEFMFQMTMPIDNAIKVFKQSFLNPELFNFTDDNVNVIQGEKIIVSLKSIDSSVLSLQLITKEADKDNNFQESLSFAGVFLFEITNEEESKARVLHLLENWRIFANEFQSILQDNVLSALPN